MKSILIIFWLYLYLINAQDTTIDDNKNDYYLQIITLIVTSIQLIMTGQILKQSIGLKLKCSDCCEADLSVHSEHGQSDV